MVYGQCFWFEAAIAGTIDLLMLNILLSSPVLSSLRLSSGETGPTSVDIGVDVGVSVANGCLSCSQW